MVADRQVPPVRQQRLAVGAEQPAQVRGVLDRAVEVDVVGDLDRQVQGDPVGRDQRPTIEVFADPEEPGRTVLVAKERPGSPASRIRARKAKSVNDVRRMGALSKDLLANHLYPSK